MSYKIMLVDDENDLRELFALFLEREGYAVEEAVNGKEAYEKILASRPDLVISDIRMPVWDGLKLMRQLQAPETKSIPILFMSGFVGVEDLKLADDTSVVGFLNKPVQVEHLMQTILNIRSSAITAKIAGPTTTRQIRS
jgi:CheY-like chemotaxis protein